MYTYNRFLKVNPAAGNISQLCKFLVINGDIKENRSIGLLGNQPTFCNEGCAHILPEANNTLPPNPSPGTRCGMWQQLCFLPKP